MGVARTIFSTLIALSVALLPVAGGVAATGNQNVTVMASETSADVSAEFVSADVAMDDCCPKPCDSDSSTDQCRSMAACAQQFLTIADVAFSQLKYAVTRGRTINLFADTDLSSHLGSPPFRPPRI
jgi:hypothetical protein